MKLLPSTGSSAAALLALVVVLATSQQCPPVGSSDTVSLLQSHSSVAARKGVSKDDLIISRDDVVEPIKGNRASTKLGDARKNAAAKVSDEVSRKRGIWWSHRPEPWLSWLLPVGICAFAVAAFLISQLFAISSFRAPRRNPQALAAGEAAIAKDFVVEASDVKPALETSPSLWSWLTLTWANPLFRNDACRQQLESRTDGAELRTLYADDDVTSAHELFQACWAQESAQSQRGHDVRLLQVLWNFVGWRQWLLLTGLVMASFALNCLAMVATVELLLGYVEWLRSRNDGLAAPDPFWSSLMVLTLCFAVPMAGAVLEEVLKLRDGRIGMRLTAALVAAICTKVQDLPVANLESEHLATPAALQSLVNDVADASTNSVRMLIQSVTTPVNMVLLIALLWSRVGASSMLVIIGFVPLVLISAKFLGATVPARVAHQLAYEKWLLLFRNAVEAKLELKSMAWEAPVMKRISEARDEGLGALWTMQNMSQQIVTVSIAWPRLVVFGVLVSFSLASPSVDGLAVFTCLQVLGYMTYLICAFSNGRAKLQKILPLAVRVEAFLKLPEAPASQTAPMQNEVGVGVSLQGSFAWRANDKPVLHDVRLRLPKGTLVAVVGEPRCGKTSLFHAVLGELYQKNDRDVLPTGVAHVAAYSAQRPWIFSSTIRDNIVLGAPEVDEKRYAAAVQAADLKQDIEALPEGDATMVTSHGGLLSESLRTRIAWARCAYSSEDLILIDDGLSALTQDRDAIRHASTVHKSFVDDPLLWGRTRLVAMRPDVAALVSFDSVIVMAGGQIMKQGSPKEVLESTAFKKLLQSGSLTPLEQASNWSTSPDREGCRDVRKQAEPKLPVERSASASFATLVQFLGLIGGGRAIAFLWLACVAQGLMVMMDVSLGQWANEADSLYAMQVGKSQGSWWLWIYAAYFIIAVSLGVATNFIGASCSRLFSQTIHDKLAHALLSPLQNFQSGTCAVNGQLDRIIADLHQADLSLWVKIGSLASMLCGIVCPLAYVHAVMPIHFTLAALPCYLTMATFASNYWKVLPKLQEHSTTQRHRLHTHLSDAVRGATSKRAFGQTLGLATAEEKIIKSYANSHFMVNCIGSQWLLIRLTACFAPVLTTAALTCVLNPGMMGLGSMGLVLVFSINVLQSFEVGVEHGTGAQQELAVAANLQRYACVSEGANLLCGIKDSPLLCCEDASPSVYRSDVIDKQGGREAGDSHVQIKSLCAGYGDYRVDVLRGFTLRLDHGQKVGLYGAPGSGKSLLLQVILQLKSSRHGTVLLDGVDASKIDSELLRSTIGLVPQDPVLLQGDVGFNMDPLHKHCTEKVSSALSIVGLDSLAQDLDQQCAFDSTGGHCSCSNFALRERRLLTVARMVLHQPALLLLDEVLLGLDARTKVLVQNTMQSAFVDSTVLAVAREPESLLGFKHISELKHGVLFEHQS